MASNGGDAISPPTETPNVEQTASKIETAPAVDPKPEQPLKTEAAPVKQVAEDLSVDGKAPKKSENSSSEASEAEKKSEGNNAREDKTSPMDDAKMEVEPPQETKTDNPTADIKTSPSGAKSESTTNGTDNKQPASSAAPAAPTAKEVLDDAPAPTAQAVESKQNSKEETSTSKPPTSVTSEEGTKQGETEKEKPEKKTSNEEASKPAEVLDQAPTPNPSKPPPPPSEESSKSAAPAEESDKPSEAPPVAVSKPASQQVKAVPPVATVAPMPKVASSSKNSNGSKSSSANKHAAECRPDGDAPPEKKAKTTPGSSASSKASGGNSSASSVTPAGGKTPQQILEYMNKTFEQRRRIITKQMPTIPELQQLYPDLFMHKQLLTEFQRITKIDIDQKIQEFCVRFATAVIEMARGKKGAAPVIARWEKAQQENHSLKQYWDMMTALCLLPLHFGENFADMVQEIGEDEEVVAQGKIVPVLVARGNVYRTDEFFLIAENTIVQEFEEFTIALASLYSSYWVFNMVYPESIENTYNYIQRCIVRQKEPGSIPTVCRNFTKALQKWNKEKEGK